MNNAINRIKSLYIQMASLRWKMFFSYLALSMIPLIFYAITALRTMDETYTHEKRQDLRNYANRVASKVASENFLTDPLKDAFFDTYIDEQRDITSYRIVVVNASGVVVNDSDWANVQHWSEQGLKLFSPDILRALDRQSSSSVMDSHMNVAVPVVPRLAGSEPVGAVLVQASLHDKNLLISNMQQRLVLLTVFLIIIILILVFFISQLIIEPLKSILAVVKRITDGRLDQRVKLYGHDEFAELGASFNNMTERLSRVDEARSEFVSNVSHELKTPLSSIKVLGESLLLQNEVDPGLFKEFLTDINSEVDRMTKIINDLLALVLLDRTEQVLSVAPFKLNNMLEDICRRLKPLADQKNIGLYLNDPTVISVEGDEMKLSLALSNVIENGIKYTNDEGNVTITLDSDNINAIITVKDTGIGINEAEQTRIFDRFYRVDKTRGRDTGGTGLGLSITHKTILLHNGAIRVSSKENEGTTFVIRLPLLESRFK
ncbi:MAG: HAMP domain-containing histidine kinase [Defluviitaleaceae bacterium]|nr:HAMP domain-containing histidine kinase [Defluviitaleaceae bacterium]MCL2836253.1 HAMP domain-containing histidine kinase [Defluviitaleaceae bacterium]